MRRSSKPGCSERVAVFGGLLPGEGGDDPVIASDEEREIVDDVVNVD